MAINTTDTVRDLALVIPNATRIFEALGIDYCCGGGRSLANACKAAQASVEEVARLLEQAELDKQETVRDWQAEPLAALTSHIVETHHAFTRAELERISQLLAKVISVHAENHPELLDLKPLFLSLNQELIPHMLKEEQVLFPYITRMEGALDRHEPVPMPFFGTVRNPVRMMMQEHDSAGELLREIRRVTNGFIVPSDVCLSFQTLYQALAGFEEDLHQHIHLENNILFPRAVEMESSAQPDRSDSFEERNEHRCFGD